ncbi:MAG TPA: hypothetical protein DCZ10_17850 [Pelotomaculum sp.]|nr:hypothetical protein [Pelotomaculum sp.]
MKSKIKAATLLTSGQLGPFDKFLKRKNRQRSYAGLNGPFFIKKELCLHLELDPKVGRQTRVSYTPCPLLKAACHLWLSLPQIPLPSPAAAGAYGSFVVSSPFYGLLVVPCKPT